jgi:hypothetical protein
LISIFEIYIRKLKEKNMRKRPSGQSGRNTYRDKLNREEKKKREEDVLKQTPTIGTFFKRANTTIPVAVNLATSISSTFLNESEGEVSPPPNSGKYFTGFIVVSKYGDREVCSIFSNRR